jgi:hypothetical protein
MSSMTDLIGEYHMQYSHWSSQLFRLIKGDRQILFVRLKNSDQSSDFHNGFQMKGFLWQKTD